jgi:hypothetical protein
MSQITAASQQSADRLIEALLAALRDLAPGASLACLNRVDAARADSIVPVPRSSVGGPCRATAMACRMESLLDWPTLLPSLREGECQIVRVPLRRPAAMRRCLWWAGVGAILLCPAAGRSGSLIGVVMIVWPRDADAPDADAPDADTPDADALAGLMQAGKRAGHQIAAVLELYNHLPAPAPCPAA